MIIIYCFCFYWVRLGELFYSRTLCIFMFYGCVRRLNARLFCMHVDFYDNKIVVYIHGVSTGVWSEI